jgi:hypothetical protein
MVLPILAVEEVEEVQLQVQFNPQAATADQA